MSAFRSRRELNAAIDELPPPHPAADPTTAQPATPGLDLDRIRSLAENLQRCAADSPFFVGFGEAILRALGDAAPAAPPTYALPAEPPPEVTELWDHEGVRWQRVEPQPPYGADWVPWELLDRQPNVAVEATDWAELVYAAGPLSSVPPAGTAVAVAIGEDGTAYLDDGTEVPAGEWEADDAE